MPHPGDAMGPHSSNERGRPHDAATTPSTTGTSGTGTSGTATTPGAAGKPAVEAEPDAQAKTTIAENTGVEAKRGPLHLVWRTVYKAWWDNIFSESAAAAFWQTLSLPPLLLGLLGSLGFLGDWLGPNIVAAVQSKIIGFSWRVFSPTVVQEIIAPTVGEILTRAHTEIISVGFLMSLWAGSSALASLVDSITLAYDQYLVRHSVWQRLFALLLYLVCLVLAVVGLPVIALGPEWLPTVFPQELQDDIAWLVHAFYYPATALLLVLALTALYKVALPRKLPWYRGIPGALVAMAVFLCSSIGLRVYFTWITQTGYTYGTLAAPIAFLLFAFFIGMAIILGAQFNNATREMWPARMPGRERRRWQRLEMRRTAQRIRTEEGYRAWRNGRTGDLPVVDGAQARNAGTRDMAAPEVGSREAGPQEPTTRNAGAPHDGNNGSHAVEPTRELPREDPAEQDEPTGRQQAGP